MSDGFAMRRAGIVATTTAPPSRPWYGAAVAVMTGPTVGTVFLSDTGAAN